MTTYLRRGKWVADVRFRHADGTTQRVLKVSPIQTAKGAKRYEKQVLHAVATGEYRKRRHKLTVADYAETFLEVARVNNKASTLKSKKDVLRKYLIPLVGPMQLAELKHQDVETLKSKLDKAGLKPKTINNVVGVLSAMLTLAAKSELIPGRPPIDWLPAKAIEGPPLTREEFERLVGAADAEWRPMLWTAVLTGLRIGELCELRWTDVDLEAGWIHVRRAVYRGEVDTPKHGRLRDVPILPELAPMLRAQRRPGVALVFSTPDGDALDPYNQPTVAMQRASRKAALGRDCGWHLLRHTWASWLGAAGVPAKTLMRLGGWGDLGMVSRYVNLSGEDLVGAIGKLGMAWNREQHG